MVNKKKAPTAKAVGNIEKKLNQKVFQPQPQAAPLEAVMLHYM
jgi:hypothetical protein